MGSDVTGPMAQKRWRPNPWLEWLIPLVVLAATLGLLSLLVRLVA